MLLATRRFNSEAAFAKCEQILQAFAESGLDAQRGAYWFRLLGNDTIGSGLADIASRELEPDATPLVLERALQRVAYPHVAAAAPHLRAGRLDAAFTYGLDILFDALARELRSRRRARTGERRRSAVRRGPAPAARQPS